MPDAQERPSYGTPAFYVKRKLFARLLEDGDSVVVKIDYGDRELRMKADPNTFHITDHCLNYPILTRRLGRSGPFLCRGVRPFRKVVGAKLLMLPITFDSLLRQLSGQWMASTG